MLFILFDLLLLAIVIVSVAVGVKKGAVKIFLSLLAIIIAAYLADFLSYPVAAFVNNTFFEPKIIKSVNVAINDSTTTLAEALPEFITDNCDEFGLNLEQTNVVDSKQFVEDSISPIIENAIASIAVILLFVILLILFNILVKLVNNLVKWSFFGGLNKLLGALFGAITGCVIVLMVCYVCYKTFLSYGKGLWFITEKTLNHSYLYNIIIDIF